MKIVRETINEITRGGTGSSLGSIGVGSAMLDEKLKKIMREYFRYSHILMNDKHGERISKMLQLPREKIVNICFDIYSKMDTEENRELFINHIASVVGLPYERTFVSYRKQYWLWKIPSFVLEYSPANDEFIMYTHKKIAE